MLEAVAALVGAMVLLATIHLAEEHTAVAVAATLVLVMGTLVELASSALSLAQTNSQTTHRQTHEKQ
jgi:hypothetical protein